MIITINIMVILIHIMIIPINIMILLINITIILTNIMSILIFIILIVSIIPILPIIIVVVFFFTCLASAFKLSLLAQICLTFGSVTFVYRGIDVRYVRDCDFCAHLGDID